MILSILGGILFFLAHIIESVGYLFRLIGKWNNLPTVGYSLHVRTGTLGRAFILLGLPLMGYIGDKFGEKDFILYSYITMSVLYFVFVLLLLRNFTSVLPLMTSSRMKLTFRPKWERNNSHVMVSFTIFFLSYSAVFFVNYVGLSWPRYKGTILQSAGFISSLGTIANVFYLDKLLSEFADRDEDMLGSLICDILLGRVLAVAIGTLVCVLILFG